MYKNLKSCQSLYSETFLKINGLLRSHEFNSKRIRKSLNIQQLTYSRKLNGCNVMVYDSIVQLSYVFYCFPDNCTFRNRARLKLPNECLNVFQF